jgi:hypothetical protein
MTKQFINIDPEELKTQYNNGTSLRKLANLYNTSKLTIKKKLEKAGIKILSSEDRIKNNPKLHSEQSKPKMTYDENHILKLAESHCITEISKKLNMPNTTIAHILSRNNKNAIKYDYSNGMKEIAKKSRKRWDNYETLYDLYMDQKKSIIEIVKIVHADGYTVKNALINYGIKLRTLEEANSLSANSPEGKKTRSRISKEAWCSIDYRNNIVNKLVGTHPIMPPDHGMKVSIAMKKLYSDPEFIKRHKARVKKLWEHPTPKMLNNLYETHKALREDTDIRRRFLEKVRDDNRREYLSAVSLDMWSDAIFLKYKLPIIRKKCSEAAKKAWQDPVYRKKMLDQMSKRSESKLEKIVHSILDDLSINHQKVRLGERYFEFDICIDKEQLKQDRGLLIEINGLYTHTRPKTVKRDAERYSFWKKQLINEYRYETVWEYDFGAYKRLFDKIIDILDVHDYETNIDIQNIIINKIDSDIAENFYNKYHYLGRHRCGYHVGAFINNCLIGCCSFSGVTRLESAEKQGLDHSEVRQLSRYCISPLYRNKNLASFFLSKSIKMFKNDRNNIKLLITFADQSAGHIGTIYKATNWIFDGMTKSSYFYEKDGFRWHKKVIWDYSRSMGLTENEFQLLFELQKIKTLPKFRYIYKF